MHSNSESIHSNYQVWPGHAGANKPDGVLLLHLCVLLLLEPDDSFVLVA